LSVPDQAPSVSVIVPAYNTADFIAECLDSVFAQTFFDFEIIVVNDGSPDTAELERVLAPYRERIVYVRHENRGLSGARNSGIRPARAEYLAFLDSDDCWPREYLSTQMRLFQENPSLDLVYADAILFGSGPIPRKTFMQTSAPPTTLDDLLSEGGQILPSGTVVKKGAIVKAGFFDETLKRCEDLDMWLRLADRGAKIAFQGNLLFLRRVHSTALTSDEEKMVSSLIRVLTKVNRAQLSARGLESLDKQLTQARGELGRMQWRKHLDEGNLAAAREDLTAAHAFFGARKFAVALLGLRLAPRVTIWGARTFLRKRGFK
jgi:hypothetical protein